MGPPVPVRSPFFEPTPSPSPPTWIYPRSRLRGAFRLVKAQPLRGTRPSIEVVEYRDIGYLKANYKTRLDTLRYVAISHVWKESPSIVITRSLPIATRDENDNPNRHNISWLGLVRIANAVVELGYYYFWLDFLCVDQRDVRKDLDKKFQICMMGDIYRYASSVVVMIGGVPDVVRMDAPTGWMDRAWTLQETVIPMVAQARTPRALRNPHPIWVYLKWETWWGTGSLRTRDIQTVTGEPDTLLVDMSALMDMADAAPVRPLPQVTVLNGQFPNLYLPTDVASLPVARRALRAALHPNRYAHSAGVWRSMFLRTSSQPVDVVYSLMGIFDVPIDPFRNERDYTYLFRDLARKTAAIPTCGPAWLTISGVDGSLIPRNINSRILPRYPHVPNDGEPTYRDQAGNRRWVGRWVDKTDDYISRFDIQFFTHSQPHIINARMIVVKYALINNRRSRTVRLGLGPSRRYQGSCICRRNGGGFFSSESQLEGCQAVYVGQVGDLKIHHRSLYANQYYFLFMRWRKSSGGWEVVGDGVFRPNRSRPRFTPAVMGRRYIFTVGKGSQTRLDKWPQEGSGPLDLRTSRFRYHSYGVLPLKDAHNGLSQTSKSIAWLGHKGGRPYNRLNNHRNWKAFYIGYRSSDVRRSKVNTKLMNANKILLVSSHAVDSPRTATSRTRDKLAQMSTLSMNYNYADWKHSECTNMLRAGIEGIMLRKTSDRRPFARYYVNLLWGEYMIYLQTISDRRTRPEYEQTVVIPYRSFNKVINTKYLIPPTPPPIIPQQPVYQYPWSREYPGLSPDQWQAMQNWKAIQTRTRQDQAQQDWLQADAAAKSALLQHRDAAQKAQWQAQGWPGGRNRCGCAW